MDIQTLMKTLEDTFGDEAAILEWLESEIIAIGHRKPRELLDTEEGRQELHDIAMRIQHGIHG